MNREEQKSSFGFSFMSFPVGPLQCNCSLLWDPQTKDALLVDPGDDFERIQKHIESKQLKVQAILHTHAHFDHIGASRAVHEWCKAPLCLHPEDKMLWEHIQMQGEAFGFELEPTIPWQKNLTDEETINFGSFSLTTLHTPGHTPGSCSFSVGDVVFAGDTLFRGSIGRTDLWGGDSNLISRSIKDRLYTLDPDTTVITGHGPSTQIGIEQRSNAFVRK